MASSLQTSHEEIKDQIPRLITKGAVYGVIGIVSIVLAEGSYFTVPQTDVAYVKRFGKVIDQDTGPLQPGLHFKAPIIDDPDLIRITTDTFELPEKKAFTKDTQEITLRVGITYKVPSTSAYHLLYEIGKAGNIDIHNNIILLSNEVVREVLSKHNVTEIAGDQRELIVGQIKKQLSDELAAILKVEISAVQINSLDFSPLYKDAINSATIARTKTITAQQDADRAKIEALTKVTQAQAEADANAARADGEGRASFVKAQAEANGNLAKAKAEAESLKVKGQGEADATRAKIDAAGGSDNYVKQIEAQSKLRWNGEVPQFMLGGNAGAAPVIFPITPPTK